MEGFSTFGTGSIDVLDGEKPLQTLDVGAGVLTLEEDAAASAKQVYPTVFDSNYLPTLVDLNFDGAQDILCMCDMGTVNGSYLCWLWDPDLGQFIAGPGCAATPWSQTLRSGRSPSAAATAGAPTTRTSMLPMSRAPWSI